MRLAAAVVWAGLLVAAHGQSAPAPELERVALGAAPSLTSTLEYIAEEQHFFQQEGLAVEVREFSSGKQALQEMLAGKLDAVSSTQFPLVSTSFERSDFRILATTATIVNEGQLIAHRRAGIRTVADLEGKRVGMVPGTLQQYHVDLLLLKHGLSRDEVSLVFKDSPALLQSLIEGRVDAAALLGQYSLQAEQQLGTNAILFYDRSLFETPAYVSVPLSLVEKRPQVAEKLLRAYLRAETFVTSHPEQALAIVTRRLQADPQRLRVTWMQSRFVVGLYQWQLSDLEEKACWEIGRGLAPSNRIPNYLNLFYCAGLDKIAPERVTIIH